MNRRRRAKAEFVLDPPFGPGQGDAFFVEKGLEPPHDFDVPGPEDFLPVPAEPQP